MAACAVVRMAKGKTFRESSKLVVRDCASGAMPSRKAWLRESTTQGLDSYDVDI